MAAATEAKRQNLAAQGARLAAPRRARPHVQAQVPHRRGQRADRRRAARSATRSSLQSLAVARLGKDVVDLLDVVGPLRRRTEVLHDIEWRIAPGERTGILGVNGAGKSTLLGLIDGHGRSRPPGRVKRGKTVKIAALTQRLDELEEHVERAGRG